MDTPSIGTAAVKPGSRCGASNNRCPDERKQFLIADVASSDRKNIAIQGCMVKDYAHAIGPEKNEHQRETCALVAVKERMLCDDLVGKTGGLLLHGRIEFDLAEPASKASRSRIPGMPP